MRISSGKFWHWTTSHRSNGKALPEIFFTSDAVLHIDGEWPDLDCELEEVSRVLGCGGCWRKFLFSTLGDPSCNLRCLRSGFLWSHRYSMSCAQKEISVPTTNPLSLGDASPSGAGEVSVEGECMGHCMGKEGGRPRFLFLLCGSLWKHSKIRRQRSWFVWLLKALAHQAGHKETSVMQGCYKFVNIQSIQDRLLIAVNGFKPKSLDWRLSGAYQCDIMWLNCWSDTSTVSTVLDSQCRLKLLMGSYGSKQELGNSVLVYQEREAKEWGHGGRWKQSRRQIFEIQRIIPRRKNVSGWNQSSATRVQDRLREGYPSQESC